MYRAFDLQEMREVAVKVHHLNSGWSEAKKQSYVLHAVREYKIHKSLCHPRVVGLLDIFEVDDSTFATVLEVCNGGDLESHLREHNALPEREARAIVVQIIQGLAYLNEPRRRIIHYDLKPANILFDSCGEVKITVILPPTAFWHGLHSLCFSTKHLSAPSVSLSLCLLPPANPTPME